MELGVAKLTRLGRERSGSYSPFLSPREVQVDDRSQQDGRGKLDGKALCVCAELAAVILIVSSFASSHSPPKWQV